jgi:hypothetical protein
MRVRSSIRGARPLAQPFDRSMAYLELAVTAIALCAAAALFLVR